MNPDVASVNWLPYDDSNPIIELNVENSVSHNAENDIYTWLDGAFCTTFRISDQTTLARMESPLKQNEYIFFVYITHTYENKISL